MDMQKLKNNARQLRLNMTEAEKKIWKKIQFDQLGFRFRRQHIIEPYIVDFYCSEKKLIIEIDGGQHCDNENDRKRDADLQQRGYSVLRFWNNDVLKNREGVVEEITQFLSLSPTLSLASKGEGV